MPVQDAFRQPINAVRIAANQSRWAEKHLRSLEMSYGKAPHFAAHREFFRDVYARPWERLFGVSEEILRYALNALDIRTPIVRSSELGVEGEATERLANLCRAAGADTYLSGAYATQAYLDPETLERAGVGLEIHHWRCPEYRQLHPACGFLPDLSIVDLLFNEGDNAHTILAAGGNVAGLEQSHP